MNFLVMVIQFTILIPLLKKKNYNKSLSTRYFKVSMLSLCLVSIFFISVYFF